jgi:hypothetical protein
LPEGDARGGGRGVIIDGVTWSRFIMAAPGLVLAL